MQMATQTQTFVFALVEVLGVFAWLPCSPLFLDVLVWSILIPIFLKLKFVYLVHPGL